MGFRTKPAKVDPSIPVPYHHGLYGKELFTLAKTERECGIRMQDDGQLRATLVGDHLAISRQDWYLDTTLSRGGLGGSVSCVDKGDSFDIFGVDSYTMVTESDGRKGLSYVIKGESVPIPNVRVTHSLSADELDKKLPKK